MRRSGILLPISSLPSKYGMGCFSKEAYEFVDFLVEAGQKLWQILPLGPTGYGDSPYQAFSTFAGNPYFIDLEQLIEAGYLTKEECDSLNFGTNPEYVDYGQLYDNRLPLLKKAYTVARSAGLMEEKEFKQFVRENKHWLENYGLFMAIKAYHKGVCWTDWEEDLRRKDPDAVWAFGETYEFEIGNYYFQQYMFAKQWAALKKYANEKGVKIIGDIPIYVAFDSADIWGNPELFQLDEEGNPLGVAGCPPDAFSATGQLWGNPLYDWIYHKKTHFAWWVKRLAHCYELYDIVRLDHFRGFDEYWFIPYGDSTAENGKWLPGPGLSLFKTLQRRLGEREIIAEDLGTLTPSVLELLKDSGYPGMKVLQFAFGGDAKNPYLPHNCVQNSVIYTGTHDNETTVGWYRNLNDRTRDHVKAYMGIQEDEEIHWNFIRTALSSVADMAIIPMQDYLGLGNEARINMPSSLGNNWQWRMKKGICTPALAKKIRELAVIYDRV